MKRFRLAQDDDGHWYLIGAQLLEEFHKWVENNSYDDVNYKGHHFEDDMIGCNPNCYSFTDPLKD